MTVTATITEVPLTTSFSFQLTVLNPCDLTNLAFDPTVADMLAYVNLGVKTQTVLAKDSASLTFGTFDGISFCGSRTYSITSSTHAFISLTVDVLTIASNDPIDADNTPVYVTVSAVLDDYPAI